jgi:hypothetical protein
MKSLTTKTKAASRESTDEVCVKPDIRIRDTSMANTGARERTIAITVVVMATKIGIILGEENVKDTEKTGTQPRHVLERKLDGRAGSRIAHQRIRSQSPLAAKQRL